jgi:hypothetical protein
MSELLRRFRSTIITTPEAEIRLDPTLSGRLMLARHNDLTVSYAPFEHIQYNARIVIVGITPGAQQASNALVELGRMLIAGAEEQISLAAAKVFASFSGPMRRNLVAMLDHVGLARWLGLPSTDALWTSRGDLAHFTSALRYPVLVDGKNYSGTPSMTETPILRQYLSDCLREEALALSQAVWIPLGPKAGQAVRWLIQNGDLDGSRVIEGLPHPSGANAERCAYFLGRKRRSDLSRKTNPVAIDQARERAMATVAALP